jgi:hypothetical protein
MTLRVASQPLSQKLGRAEAASAAMRRAVEQGGDSGGYQYAEIHAQWGENTSLRTDPLMDPLRKEPRFQAVERALKFPD